MPAATLLSMPVSNAQIRRAALHSGLSAGYISRVLRGKRNPRLKAFNKIATAMRMSPNQLQKLIEERSAEGVPAEVSTKISEGMRKSRERRTQSPEATL